MQQRAGWLAGLFVYALASCTDGGGPAPTAATPPVAAPGAPVVEAVPEVETSTFFLAARAIDAPYRVGKAGRFAVDLEGRGPWKVNQEFPLRIKVAAPEAAGVHKLVLERQDASIWTEQAAKFEIAVLPAQAGTHSVACDVSFSMCTPEQCILETRRLALDLSVK